MREASKDGMGKNRGRRRGAPGKGLLRAGSYQMPALLRISSTRLVCSQVNSGSLLPKCP